MSGSESKTESEVLRESVLLPDASLQAISDWLTGKRLGGISNNPTENVHFVELFNVSDGGGKASKTAEGTGKTEIAAYRDAIHRLLAAT